jgi:prepilin-type N-terminal cleavage/methylation domain-containing protein
MMSLRRRRGFTLIEVMIALVILSVVLLGMSSYITKFTRSVTESGVRSEAGDLVSDRLETIKSYGDYTTLEAEYVGSEVAIPGHDGFQRVTQIVHVNNATYNYKVITVTVTGPAMATPVRKSTIISSF